MSGPRSLTTDDFARPNAAYVVWEVTRHCDQPCQHCGSRAGPRLADELDTAAALEVVASFARLGCRECALIGGEAYLRADLPVLIEALVSHGIRAVMQTGGRGLTSKRVARLKAAGLDGIGVSIDGLEHSHDQLRGNRGSWAAAWQAAERVREAGLVLTVNSQINRLNLHELPELARKLRAREVAAWQVQLTVPMGRAADRPEWIMQPWQIPEVLDTLAGIQREAIEQHEGDGPVFNVMPNNNIGYFGPHEELLRSVPGGISTHWQGCRAGINVLSVEADGVVKACPSLPTADYAGANVKDLSLDEIWRTSPNVRFARDRAPGEELWGFCKHCYYGETCQAGCSWTAHCILGRRGNNPWCTHRATQLRRQGKRERLVQIQRAPQTFYDRGRFEIVVEPWNDEPEPTGPRRLPLV